jgi:hypothetical protein
MQQPVEKNWSKDTNIFIISDLFLAKYEGMNGPESECDR